MFRYLKKLFTGVDEDEENFKEFLELNERLSAPRVNAGKQLAEQYMAEKLLKGGYIQYYEVEDAIESKYNTGSQAVINGFLTRMDEYKNDGTIEIIPFERGELVFIHKDYAENFYKEIMEKLKS